MRRKRWSKQIITGVLGISLLLQAISMDVMAAGKTEITIEQNGETETENESEIPLNESFQSSTESEMKESDDVHYDGTDYLQESETEDETDTISSQEETESVETTVPSTGDEITEVLSQEQLEELQIFKQNLPYVAELLAEAGDEKGLEQLGDLISLEEENVKEETSPVFTKKDGFGYFPLMKKGNQNLLNLQYYQYSTVYQKNAVYRAELSIRDKNQALGEITTLDLKPGTFVNMKWDLTNIPLENSGYHIQIFRNNTFIQNSDQFFVYPNDKFFLKSQKGCYEDGRTHIYFMTPNHESDDSFSVTFRTSDGTLVGVADGTEQDASDSVYLDEIQKNRNSDVVHLYVRGLIQRETYQVEIRHNKLKDPYRTDERERKFYENAEYSLITFGGKRGSMDAPNNYLHGFYFESETKFPVCITLTNEKDATDSYTWVIKSSDLDYRRYTVPREVLKNVKGSGEVYTITRKDYDGWSINYEAKIGTFDELPGYGRYQIRFEPNALDAAGVMEPINCKFDEKVSIPDNEYERTGFRFKCYNTMQNGSGIDYQSGQIVSALTDQSNAVVQLFAQWTPKTYQIEFSPGKNDHGVQLQAGLDYKGDMRSVTLKAGQEIKLPENRYQRPGYLFRGWKDSYGNLYQNQEGVSNLVVDEERENVMVVKFEAIWEKRGFTITYSGLKGAINQNPSVYSIEDQITLKAPELEGYDFAGWYTDSDYSKGSFLGDTIPKGTKGNLTLYAKWTRKKTQVTYYANDTNGTGNGASVTQQIAFGKETALKENIFKREGYRFCGWSTTPNGAVEYANKAKIKGFAFDTSGKAVYVKGITLYAIWASNGCQIVYTGAVIGKKGVIMNENPITYDPNLTTQLALKKPVRQGYTFLGWFQDAKKKKELPKNGDNWTLKTTGKKITVYAKWSPKTMKIHFEPNGVKNSNSVVQGGMADQTIAFGSQTPIQKNRFQLAGYRFLGWSTVPDASSIMFSDKEVIKGIIDPVSKDYKEEITLYAIWKQKKYTIEYRNSDGGLVTGCSNPSSYTVEGYYKQGQLINTSSFSLESPEKKGYTFAGWYLVEDQKRTSLPYQMVNGKRVYQFSCSLADHVVLEAKWRENVFKITFYQNTPAGAVPGGKQMKAGTYQISKTLTLPKCKYSVKGYRFLGWSTERDYLSDSLSGAPFYENREKVKNLIPTNETGVSNINLYAVWGTTTAYEICFHKNASIYEEDSSDVYSQTASMTKAIRLRGNSFSRPGYTFNGWNTRPDGTGTYYENKQKVSAISRGRSRIDLYAMWK